MKYESVVGPGQGKRIAVERLDENRYLVGDRERAVNVEVLEPGVYSIIVDDASYEVSVREDKKGYVVEVGPHFIPVRVEDPLSRGVAKAGAGIEGEAMVSSPMPGRVVGVKVEVGQTVKEGEGVVLVEAMKMENELHAPKDGKVKKIAVKMGDAVEAGQDLVVIE